MSTGDDPLPARRRRGRPTLPEDQQRLHAVTCRLTTAERDRVDAARGGVSRGEFIRLAALARPPRTVPELNRIAWQELARVGANLNQLARRANSEGDFDDMAAVAEQVAELRVALIGARLSPASDEEGDADEN